MSASKSLWWTILVVNNAYPTDSNWLKLENGPLLTLESDSDGGSSSDDEAQFAELEEDEQIGKTE